MPAKLAPKIVATAIDLHAQGWSQRRVAQHLGVHERTLSRHLCRRNREAFDRMAEDVVAEKGRQIACLDQIASELYRAWEKSKENACTVKTTTVGERVRQEVTIKTQNGNPVFLSEIRKTLEQIRNILFEAGASKAQRRATEERVKSARRVLKLYAAGG
jgi:hypothetical protein